MNVPSILDDQASPSLFEGINARYYRANEVARSFVPNEQFDNLIVRQHSLVVGPRGSGKTTLLRMLHPECMGSWEHAEGDKYRSLVEFTGIYIPTDRVWRDQLESAATNVSRDLGDEFAHTVVGIDAMAAFLKSIRIRLHDTGESGSGFRKIELSKRDVARLTGELAEGWKVRPKFLDLASLKVALRKRRIEARSWIGAASHDVPVVRPDWWGVRWEEAVLLGVDAFEASTGISDELWALLFDEAEIAPPAIRDSIIHATRAFDPRLLIKCSLSPWLDEWESTMSISGGTVFNDFKLVQLFYGKREASYKFSRDLIASRIRSAGRFVESNEPIEDVIFGRSRFVGSEEDEEGRSISAYETSTQLGRVVANLAEIDPQFRSWLEAMKIDPKNLEGVSGEDRAKTLRKARNIMIARLEFRRDSGQLKSRKTIAMYAGGSTMLDICEGNPRLLLGLILPLLEYFDGVHAIPESVQADALGQIADDFYALIDAIPLESLVGVPPELRGPRYGSPYRYFIDRVAKYFRDRTLRGPFNPQPPSTFKVPSGASTGLQQAIGRLINAGAIIVITERGVKDVIIGRFDQQRMRLCYLIAAREKLPPNVDRPVSVLRILGRQSKRSGGMKEPLPGLDADVDEDAE